MMESQLRLSVAQHQLIWKRKSTLETRFKAKILSPAECAGTPFNWVYKGFSVNETLIVSVKGDVANVEALENYVNGAFLRPEIIEIFTYQPELKPIFEDSVWIEIFEEIYNVYITIKQEECELNISGAESSVSSAVSAMEELIVKYNECKDTLFVSDEKSLSEKLVYLLKVCRNADISSASFSRIPNDVIVLLLSLLEKVYKEDLPQYDSSLEESVLILPTPEKKIVDISVIDLGSDSDDDSNSKSCLQSGSGGNISNGKRAKRPRRKGCRGKKLKNNKRCDFQEGSNFQDQVPQQNGLIPQVQIPQVGSSTENKLALTTNNQDFISLRLESKLPLTTNNQDIVSLHPQSSESTAPKRLRPIVIDGSNVAFYSSCGRREDFSWKRIEISLRYFQERGHTEITVFLPQHRRTLCYEKAGKQSLIEKLENEQLIIFTPSRRVDGRVISCYDDRFIVDLASRKGGVILSNDNYRDLMTENEEWTKTIKQRLLMYVFAGEELMIPDDPLGVRGPRLNDFLTFPDDS